MTTLHKYIIRENSDRRNFMEVHMHRYPFIFSDRWKYLLQRHAAFWIFWWLFQGFLYSFVAADSAFAYVQRLPMSMLESFFFMFNHMFLAYSLMYFVIPHFLLKQKYWHTAVWTILFFLITALMSTLIGRFLVDPLRDHFLGEGSRVFRHTTRSTMFLSLLAGLRGGLTIGGIAAAIKLMK
jgi:hypothetical protein